MTKIYDEVIVEILQELDLQQSTYQLIYSKYYGKIDNEAKQIYSILVSMCERIRKEISLRERK